MDTELILPGAVEVDLGEFRLIPGPKGDAGERGPRGYGIKSAKLNPDYTLTLTFEDGASYTTPSIRGEDGVDVKDVRLEPGEYGGGNYSDKIVVELSDGKLFEFEIYNRAAEYYDRAEAAKTAAEESEQAAARSEENARNSAEASEASAQRSEAAKDASAEARDAAVEAKTAAQAAKDGAVAARTAAEESAAKALESENAAKKSETAAQEQADKAREYSGNPPIIQGDTQTWWTWDADAGEYRDTAKPSRGNLLFASFWVDPETCALYMITDREYNGPQLRLNKNILEVVINAPGN